MNRRDVLKAVAASTVVSSTSAFARQDQAKFFVGYPAGTATDAIARLLGERMRGDYAANFVVENKAGASGTLAVLATKASPADGSAILVSPASVMSVVPHTIAKVAYDPFQDFIPVGNCVSTDFALAIGSSVPASITTLAQFIDWCKSNPSKASYGTGATGTKIHFSGLRLGKLAGFEFAHVGYTNGGGALTDLAGGNIPAYIGTVPTVMPFLNRIRVIATFGEKRSRFLPNVPTVAEAGFKDATGSESISLYLPARTADTHVQSLHAAMLKALATPEAAAALNTLGLEAAPSTQSELRNRLKSEHEQWGQFIKQIGYQQSS